VGAKAETICLLVKLLQAKGLHLSSAGRAGLALAMKMALLADHLRKGEAA
jgi:hypothetical protein